MSALIRIWVIVVASIPTSRDAQCTGLIHYTLSQPRDVRNNPPPFIITSYKFPHIFRFLIKMRGQLTIVEGTKCMKTGEKCNVFANRNHLVEKRLKNGQNAKNRTLFLFLYRLKNQKPFANRPLFWTKTDLRKTPALVYTRKQKLLKVTRSEPKKAASLVHNDKRQSPNFPGWRDCRGIGPIEGTEIQRNI